MKRSRKNLMYVQLEDPTTTPNIYNWKIIKLLNGLKLFKRKRFILFFLTLTICCLFIYLNYKKTYEGGLSKINLQNQSEDKMETEKFNDDIFYSYNDIRRHSDRLKINKLNNDKFKRYRRDF